MSQYMNHMNAEELMRFAASKPQLTPLETALSRALSNYVYADARELSPPGFDEPVQLSFLFEQEEKKAADDYARG